MTNQRVDELPVSTDEAFWLDGVRTRHQGVPVRICVTHRKDNWTEHIGYVQEPDGTLLCTLCPWGTKNPGRYRVIDGRLVDLRDLIEE